MYSGGKVAIVAIVCFVRSVVVLVEKINSPLGLLAALELVSRHVAGDEVASCFLRSKNNVD
jgi:hypothetical protein